MMLAAVSAAVAGCAPEAPPARITYHRAPIPRFRRIHRIVFIELTGPGDAPGLAEDMTDALVRALQGRGIFRVDGIARSDPSCRDLPLDGTQHTLEQLITLRKAFQCDALLLGSVHHYRAYPRMQVGLFAKLLDLRNGDLLWGVDHIWDTTDRATELRIRDFFLTEMRSGYGPVHWELGLVSPRAFMKFVAYEVAETLPSARTVAAADAKKRRRPGNFSEK